MLEGFVEKTSKHEKIEQLNLNLIEHEKHVLCS